MKSFLIFIFLLILTSAGIYSQDIITRTNGEKIVCRIEKEDSLTVYFISAFHGNEIHTKLDKSQIKSIEYEHSIGQPVYRLDNSSFGLGFGIDKGGLGGSLILYPQKNIGLFFGLGYPLYGVGYNTGVKFRLTSKKPKSGGVPYLLAIYGYNAGILVMNAPEYNKLFYGPTLGFGFDLHPNRERTGYFSLALLIPIRGSEVNDYIKDLEDNHGVEFETVLLPIGISMEYRFVMGRTARKE